MLNYDHAKVCLKADIIEPQITSVMPRKRGHNPKSPEGDAKGGDLYMRLPQNRLRKVRNTMYEDPGNPFTIEEYEDRMSPPTAYVNNINWQTDNSETWPLPDLETVKSSPRADRDNFSVLSDPFDLVNDQSNRETWSSFESNRRSMSVDIGFLPMLSTVGQRRSSDFELSWPLHVPTMHIEHPRGIQFTMDTKRDTRFYDFYDDLLAEYETVGDSDGAEHRQRMLQVEL